MHTLVNKTQRPQPYNKFSSNQILDAPVGARHVTTMPKYELSCVILSRPTSTSKNSSSTHSYLQTPQYQTKKWHVKSHPISKYKVTIERSNFPSMLRCSCSHYFAFTRSAYGTMRFRIIISRTSWEYTKTSASPSQHIMSIPSHIYM